MEGINISHSLRVGHSAWISIFEEESHLVGESITPKQPRTQTGSPGILSI